ncbi:Sec-dependent nitrous-oxide reductase [Mucilaginibacter sp.]|uniref:Sec-dependent nitrous-oxide reductase n=1 Tax=Mucilaginibacter sp. TaxID=1882438 RepID=UPI002849B7F9|nr:Sec-dependent nitrous-oxide reductase [Mucilaginibacter sp.]MDR3694781.1 Sec-dependent nitrous-oxide reductase [Mucilaginibacter sp.]
MKISPYKLLVLTSTVLVSILASSCKPGKAGSSVDADAAKKVYVAPGKYDEIYAFLSGGFSGQIAVYGIPSGRLLKVLPVFSQNPENGYGYSEETKPMLNTSHGFVPWDDSHHPELSKTNGEDDGRWLFINANNTPRIARLNLATFKTVEILELPNIGGNHASPFCTENTEYVVGNTRFSEPLDNSNGDVPISSFKQNFKGAVSFVKVNKDNGTMNLAFQLLVPPFDYDLAHAGKGPSHDWIFFTCYNTEEAHTLLEVNASQRDKDFIMAVNWKKAEELIKEGKGTKITAKYAHNVYNENSHTATSTMETATQTLDVTKFPGLVYYMPCPKSPHGIDVTPDGEYMAASGKLAAVIPVFSFKKMLNAIDKKQFDGMIAGDLPVLKYEDVLHGEVKKPGLGPLHTEFDGKGYGYTTMFVSSEIVKWKIDNLEIIDRIPSYYSPGHLSIVGGDSKKPFGKYLLALNKITKDRYLPTGPELAQACQLIDITGNKMKLLLDFPTIGEPHYAQMIPADKILKNQIKFFKLEDNKNAYVTKSEKDTKVVRSGNRVDVYMTAIRSHLAPDNIEGIKIGDEVYVHITNLEQDWDVPHGFAIKGNNNAELLVMPGETCTLKWVPGLVGIVPFYCTDFCSALHQEMQGYFRVSPAGSTVPIKFSIGVNPVTE